MNKEPHSFINRNVNVNINLNKKKIIMPIKNGYNMNQKINKISKIKIENIGKDKNKVRNKQIYYDINNYNVFNTSQSFYENQNTNLNISNRIIKQNSISEVANLQNIFIEDKENIIPNHNNSFNYNTISNNHTKKLSKPNNIKLYHGNNSYLPKENISSNYNAKTKIIPFVQSNEPCIFKKSSNNPKKLADSKQKVENRNYYNNQDNNIKKEQNYYKNDNVMIQPKKIKSIIILENLLLKKSLI